MNAWGNQANNYTAQTIQLQWPATITTSGTTLVPYYPLQPVAAPGADYAIDRDAKLSPVEWLTRQVDDVCRLARAA